ncbi:MAG: cell division protein ZapA [Candidatus Tritonobacter lacicola]|nr:cell division protein ZapA [Candidatus Tritonobacter lacicola]
MRKASQVIKVTIFGREYPIAAEGDGSSVEEVASFVDNKMNELSREVEGLPSGRVAVLACLNIAEELLCLRRIEKKRRKALVERIDSLLGLIETELVG